MRQIVRLGSVSAMIGGALRIVAALVPFAPEQAMLEAFYAAIDVSLLFGLLAVYLSAADSLGKAGLVGFAIAFIGMASIVGPDSRAFGVDFYLLGATVFIVGMSWMSIQLIRSGILVAAAISWLTAAGFGAVFAVVAKQVYLSLSGIALGAGFLVAGFMLVNRKESADRASLAFKEFLSEGSEGTR